MSETKQPVEMNVADVIFREDLYPRINHDPALVQRYAQNLECLPPIEVNQDGLLIDGWHRWTGHRKAEAPTIKAIVTHTKSEREVRLFADQRNNAHGWQMDEASKRREAIWLYEAGAGCSKEEIANALSVSVRSVSGYLSEIDKQMREERKARIFGMWLACHTDSEIASSVGFSDEKVRQETQEGQLLEALPKVGKVAATFSDEEFDAPLYNVWTFAKKSNEVSHFGNSEQRIVENLLYLYTEPFDIVLDPFAGGGSTIDVCKKRLRRYWISDRKPIVEREAEIRTLDIAADLPPLHKRWSDVALTYLDPPYWRQAQGKYSKDAEDLANMPLDQFTQTLASIVRRIAEKQSKGVIALLIQPTQWSADERQFTDHINDLVSGVKSKRLTLENRVSCPYSTEQYNAQQVEWAKENRKLLVITRELIVWRVSA